MAEPGPSRGETVPERVTRSYYPGEDPTAGLPTWPGLAALVFRGGATTDPATWPQLDPAGGSPLAVGGVLRGADPATETLVGYGRRVMPWLYRIFDKLPDIEVRRGVMLPKGEAGRYTPLPRARPYEPPPAGPPGGTIDIRQAPPSLYDELVGLTHEGRHALQQYQPSRGYETQWDRLMRRMLRQGDLTPELETAYRQHGGLSGRAHAVLEGLSQRAVRQGWPAGLSRTATESELDAALRALGR
jgi:hypothetical protein